LILGLPGASESGGSAVRRRYWASTAVRRDEEKGALDYAAALFAARAARAFARFATNAAFRAGDSFVLGGAFFADLADSWIAAHRFFVAATIAARPALLSFRLGLGAASGADSSVAFLDSAQRFPCASAMRFRAAALIFRRLCFGTAGAPRRLV
jgi:hypothetical protein